MRTEDMKPGMIVVAWHQSSERDASPIYCRVLKVNRVTVKVQTEYGEVKNAYAAMFHPAPSGWFPQSLALVMSLERV